MTIIGAIRNAVEAGELKEPFTVGDVAAVIRTYGYGSLQACVSRYSRQGVSGTVPVLLRVSPGLYCLARHAGAVPD